MLAIRNNLMSMNAARNLGKSYDNLSTSVERLSSGLRINSSKDDAAGLAVRELIRADVAALNQGVRNANDGVSMLQAAEGALGEIDSILIRMKELVEQANTGTYSVKQIAIMQSEYNELCTEVTRITTSTDFNGNKLLDNTGTVTISLGQGNSTGTVAVQGQNMGAAALNIGATKAVATGPSVADTGTTTYITGAGAAETLTINIGTDPLTIDAAAALTLQDVVDALNVQSDIAHAGWECASIRGDALNGYQLQITGYTAGAAANFTATPSAGTVVWGTVYGGGAGNTVATADFYAVNGAGTERLVTQSTTADALQTAIETKDSFRASLGYKMNRLEAAAAVLAVQAENLSAAESRISDVDVATEMSELTRSQVLAQAGISMLAQANSMPQMALQLLQG
ncbi:MAG: hypothetical protein JW849_06525 [Phycisphaerae bacterium]|nr:hypothetical protein [Phycisphaerae bacterium]